LATSERATCVPRVESTGETPPDHRVGSSMPTLPSSLATHRVRASDIEAVCVGDVRYSPTKSIWTLGMLAAAVVGGWLTFTWSAALLFVISTIVTQGSQSLRAVKE